MGIERVDKIMVVAVLGPTSSGKSSLAVKLAERFRGEIVSADSRQVYKGMDIGSGKVTDEEKRGIPHHLLDVASPKRSFSAGRYQRLAERAIYEIAARNKLPIICGGTAFYVKTILEGISLPQTKPDWKFRKLLERKGVEELYEILEKLDPIRAENIERKNPRRLVRAIEIATKRGVVPPIKKNPKFISLKLGIKTDRDKLDRAIKKRIVQRLEKGMVEETRGLRESGISWKRLEGFGLEYKWTAKYLQGKVSHDEMIKSLHADTVKFSKKQMAWFKADEEIKWIKGYGEAVPLVRDFLQKKER